MKKIILVFLFFLISIQDLSAHIPQGANQDLIDFAKQGRDFILNREYIEAQNLFLELEKKYPQSPLGIFGQISILQSRMFENFDFRLENEFKALANKNEMIIKNLLKNNDASAWDLYLAGASQGVMAFYYIRTDQLFKAIDAAGSSQDALKKAIEKDPQFYDPLFGLGMHLYWRSAYTYKFKFLPFFKDQRKEGIEKMKLAIEKGDIGKPLSMAGLVFVYWNAGKYAQALQISRTLSQMYPKSAIAKNLSGNMLIAMGQYDPAIALFKELKKDYPDLYIVDYFLAYCIYKKKDYKNAQNTFHEFLKHKPAPAWHAYALYNLAHIDLHFNRRKEAFEKFKQGSRIYPEFKGNLQALQKMRKENLIN